MSPLPFFSPCHRESDSFRWTATSIAYTNTLEDRAATWSLPMEVRLHQRCTIRLQPPSESTRHLLWSELFQDRSTSVFHWHRETEFESVCCCVLCLCTSMTFVFSSQLMPVSRSYSSANDTLVTNSKNKSVVRS